MNEKKNNKNDAKKVKSSLDILKGSDSSTI